MSGWIIRRETVYRVPRWANTEEQALEALEEGWGRCLEETHTVERELEWTPAGEEQP